MPLSSNFRASIFMMLSMGIFTIGDSITKILATEMSSGQYMLIRGVFATSIIAGLAWYHDALNDLRLDRMTLLRVVSEVVATVTYIYALGELSQAFTSAVFQATPLVVTLGAALFLGEKVGWRRWSCVLAGMVGVLIIIRPGGNETVRFASIAILLLSVLAAATRDVATRRIPARVPTLYLSALTSAAITVVGAGLTLPMGGFVDMSWTTLGLCLAAAIMLLIGYHFIILAMREGDVSFVSPFRYTSLLWAILLSILIFGEWPDWMTIVGSVIVVSSGVFMVYRENALNKRRRHLSTLASIPTGVEP